MNLRAAFGNTAFCGQSKSKAASIGRSILGGDTEVTNSIKTKNIEGKTCETICGDNMVPRKCDVFTRQGYCTMIQDVEKSTTRKNKSDSVLPHVANAIQGTGKVVGLFKGSK